MSKTTIAVSEEKNELIKKLKSIHLVTKSEMVEMIIDDYMASHPEYNEIFKQRDEIIRGEVPVGI